MVPDVCPNCGTELPAGAIVCPECGSDEETGWSAEAKYDDLNLPKEPFDYDDFAEREFGGESTVPRGLHWFWWMVAILLIAFLFYIWLR